MNWLYALRERLTERAIEKAYLYRMYAYGYRGVDEGKFLKYSRKSIRELAKAKLFANKVH